MKIFEERLNEFLKGCKTKLKKDAEIIVCIGNEGCDLDSFISSLVISFTEDVIHVVNMKKEIFIAKGELMVVCNDFKIDIDNLIYLERPIGDDKDTNQAFFSVKDEKIFLKDKNITLILTDHSRPVKELTDYSIKMIIDHHPLEHHVEKAKRIYIDVDVGSSATLVSRYLGDELSRKKHCIKDRVKDDEERERIRISIAKLLIIPIIVDTKILKIRASELDKLEYTRLKKIIGYKKKDVKKIRRELKIARRNDDKFPTSTILQKDFKEFDYEGIKFGISVVKYKFEDWIQRETTKSNFKNSKNAGINLQIELDEFRSKMGLDFFLVFCKLNHVRHCIPIKFPLMKKFELDHEFELVNFKGLEIYKMPETYSRKIVVPFIYKFLRNMFPNK